MRKKTIWLIFGAVTGMAAGIAGLAWLGWRESDKALPWRVFQRGLTGTLGADQADCVVRRAEQLYAGLVQRQQPPQNPHLRVHLYKRILPGLALYHALIELEGGSKPSALDALEGAFRAWVEANYKRTMRLLHVLPGAKPIFRLGFATRMQEFPPEGWDLAWGERSRDRLAFNMNSCYYLKTLTALKAPELTPRFCQLDDWMAEMLPPEIRFQRTKTLARGGDCCDFTYEFEK